jgi:type II secretory pathway pseudopilin PulG
VETVVFIVIVSVAAYALFRSLSSLLPRSPSAAQLTQATQLAQERMELILGQRDVLGYNNSNNTVDFDPCTRGGPASVCASAFTVSSAGTAAASGTWVAWNANPTSTYKLVTVTVSLGGVTLAKQNAVLSSYLP